MELLRYSPCGPGYYAPVQSHSHSDSRPRIRAVNDVTSHHFTALEGDSAGVKRRLLQKYKVTALDRVKKLFLIPVRCAASWATLGIVAGGIGSLCTWNPAPLGIGAAAGTAIGTTVGVPKGIYKAITMKPADKLADKIADQEARIKLLEKLSLPFSRAKASVCCNHYNELAGEREKLNPGAMKENGSNFTEAFIAELDEKITTLRVWQDTVKEEGQKLSRSERSKLLNLVDLKQAILDIHRKAEELQGMKDSLAEMRDELKELRV